MIWFGNTKRYRKITEKSIWFLNILADAGHNVHMANYIYTDGYIAFLR